ncbi:hypothetical protein Smp_147350 [Schistosoma mansoni]|uniref:hypothetical protein n=1 Tax=Schistosoma mansoni TaxID=6183 RepID=UPI0001A63EF0|nr:hypothetical protein Smp_147350 [Schistosoma mansoni]|eukprot:XP_018650272.1 hypothetical protein Smp_147350 [Schistosoma mansoni]
MTMTRQGCERETKFRVSKHVEGKVTLFCPSTSNRSPSCEVPYSDDNLYDEIISEITIRRFTDSLKTMDNGESEVKFETVLNQRAPNFTNDPELLSSLLKKNEALLKENTDYKSVIKRQTSQIKLLESKLKMIHADMREDNIGSIDQKNIERLQRRCEELQEQASNEMNKYIYYFNP